MKRRRFDPALIAALQPDAIERSDREHLSPYNEAVERAIARSRTVESRRGREQWRLRPELGPIALDGDPATATVLLLKANPSFGIGATRQTHFQPHPDWPLSVAGPHIVEGTRHYYQGRVFGRIRGEGISLEQISRRLLKVELCPWASRKWPTGEEELLKQLADFPSRKPICALVDQIAQSGAVVLIARAEEEWFAAVPSLKRLEGKSLFISATKVAPAISPRMYPGSWLQVLEAIRREVNNAD